ncbi:ornithine cyclodeaminase family protein [Natrarchaeobaculum sulfurireducens]|uniref:Alanine dehydrogenase/(1)-pyrroline-2-carboxylate reductase ProC n=1 Tax=Natrarchaeobaculum sulfurireducens TaxID=2044521 RepID=A0A346PH75_9EURY|nr:ornithine cyclodeaminase family protein [Natrarchaeobaculum sulfurireducens]AXR78870.1 Alanine dehydrogenase/(1)-pyrroline-2-carboxylate reductase ProC [Natrarchaeobaculum sulfurireducens]
MVTVLTADDVESLCDVETMLPAVETALVEQASGAVERPDRPHFPVGAGLDDDTPHGTGLTMPAYVHGEPYYATKLASVHEGNAARGLPTIQAQIALTDARTGTPVAYMPGTRVTNVRTGCVGGLAARALAAEPVRLAVIGAGAQARWQTRAIATTSDLESVTVYSRSDSKHDCADDLRADGIPAETAETAADAVSDATVVVTATTSTEPVFPADATDAELVVAVGAYEATMQELEPELFERADRVFADVPGEAIETGDLQGTSVREADLVALAEAFDGDRPDEPADGLTVVKSVGSAVMDLTAATTVYERSVDTDAGTDVPFRRVDE